METELKSAMLLIDGDNIEAAYADQMLAVANKLGRVKDIHLFANFTKANGKAKSWDEVIDKYAMEAHHSPSLAKQKNSADIRLMLFLMSCLYERDDIATFIIAANDNDYNPVVVEIHHFGKIAVNLYTDKKRSDKLLAVYDKRILIDNSKPVEAEFPLTPSTAETEKAEKIEKAEKTEKVGFNNQDTGKQTDSPKLQDSPRQAEAPRQKDGQDRYEELVKTIKALMESGLKKDESYSLSELANHLRSKKKKFSVKTSYKTRYSTFKKFLTAIMTDYPDAFNGYIIDTDNIKRK